MKAIMVMFDSLNRHFLPPYGGDVHAPNFSRLAQRTTTFDTSYVGSMPCMPARREIHTGRHNFLHRSWGPIEPFDDSMPEILRGSGVHTHLISDHLHYWEEGGANYHTRYTTWEIVRGKQGDQWKANLPLMDRMPGTLVPERGRGKPVQDWVNRHYMVDEADHNQTRTFALAEDFLRTNAASDDWFLHVETFDPHEPYYVPQRFVDLYGDDYDGPLFDWPPYRTVGEEAGAVKHMRTLCRALHSMCDHSLGRVLDLMDELDLWKDTMLIVNTDHGFLLGEHDSWAKCWCPFWEEVSHTPLFVWDPRTPASAGQRRRSLVQTIDLAPTLLEWFDRELPADMQGVPLTATIADDAPVREAGLFGIFGGHVNVTDGRHVYMRAPSAEENAPLFQYTHMPTHMRHTFSVEEMRSAELAEPMPFTKGCPTMRIAGSRWLSDDPNARPQETMLFDVIADPKQAHPLSDPQIEAKMVEHLRRLMRWNDAPPEQFERLGLA